MDVSGYHIDAETAELCTFTLFKFFEIKACVCFFAREIRDVIFFRCSN